MKIRGGFANMLTHGVRSHAIHQSLNNPCIIESLSHVGFKVPERHRATIMFGTPCVDIGTHRGMNIPFERLNCVTHHLLSRYVVQLGFIPHFREEIFHSLSNLITTIRPNFRPKVFCRCRSW
jgi:hypothetical protein